MLLCRLGRQLPGSVLLCAHVCVCFCLMNTGTPLIWKHGHVWSLLAGGLFVWQTPAARLRACARECMSAWVGLLCKHACTHGGKRVPHSLPRAALLGQRCMPQLRGTTLTKAPIPWGLRTCTHTHTHERARRLPQNGKHTQILPQNGTYTRLLLLLLLLLLLPSWSTGVVEAQAVLEAVRGSGGGGSGGRAGTKDGAHVWGAQARLAVHEALTDLAEHLSSILQQAAVAAAAPPPAAGQARGRRGASRGSEASTGLARALCALQALGSVGCLAPQVFAGVRRWMCAWV